MGSSHALYSRFCVQWQGSINSAIFLEKNHRFKNDPEWGCILERISIGKATKEDIDEINLRFVCKLMSDLFDLKNPCYACPYNKQRNTNAIQIFQIM